MHAAAIIESPPQAVAGGRNHSQAQQGIQHLIYQRAVQSDSRLDIAVRYARCSRRDDDRSDLVDLWYERPLGPSPRLKPDRKVLMSHTISMADSPFLEETRHADCAAPHLLRSTQPSHRAKPFSPTMWRSARADSMAWPEWRNRCEPVITSGPRPRQASELREDREAASFSENPQMGIAGNTGLTVPKRGSWEDDSHRPHLGTVETDGSAWCRSEETGRTERRKV